MRSVVWADSARRDMARIDDWFADVDPQFADRLGLAAIAAARFLIDFPFAGPAVPDSILRKWPVPRTDYRLFYVVTESGLEIVRVRHVREDRGDDE